MHTCISFLHKLGAFAWFVMLHLTPAGYSPIAKFKGMYVGLCLNPLPPSQVLPSSQMMLVRGSARRR